MKPRINVLTLGVNDLQKSLAFYRDGLGLATEGVIGTQFEDGAVVFFHMKNGLILALFPRASLAKDAKVGRGAASAADFSVGHLVNSRAEVDAVLQQAKRAGATIAEPARQRVWGGYSGYFQDPDGHLWEIVWNPDLPVED